MTQPPEPTSGNPYAHDDQPDERPVETVRTSIDQYGGSVTRIALDEMTSDQLDQLYARLDEARVWARHGYEIGQRHCGWTDHGTAPAWLTDGWPRSFDSCEHLDKLTEFDLALTAVRAELTALEAELYPVADDGMVIAIRRIRAVLDQHSQTPKETT